MARSALYVSNIPPQFQRQRRAAWPEIVCLQSCCLSGVVSTERWRQLLWLLWPGALRRPAPQPPGDIEMEPIQETGILRTPRKLAREGGGGKRCEVIIFAHGLISHNILHNAHDLQEEAVKIVQGSCLPSSPEIHLTKWCDVIRQDACLTVTQSGGGDYQQQTPHTLVKTYCK